MEVYLVRHAIAEERSPQVQEEQRALTPEGSQRFALHVKALQRLGVKLDEIWTSPLVRAKQTADLLTPLNAGSQPRIVEELSPNGSIDGVIHQIVSRPELGSVAVVGHEPGMSLLAAALLASQDEAGVEFKKGAVACIEVQPASQDEPVSAHTRLRWLMTPKQLRTLGSEAVALVESGQEQAGEAKPVAERLVAFCRKQLDKLQSSLDSIGGEDDADAVHDFRVATRRLSEPLRVLAAVVDAKRIRKLRSELGDLRRTFRTVRDLDVLVGSIGRDRDAQRLEADAAARAIATLSAARALSMQAAGKALGDLKPARAGRRIEALCESVAAAADGSNGAALDEALRGRWEVKADGALAFEPDPPPDSDLHALRIRLKGLRYCTELRAAVSEFADEELLTALRTVQDSLGLWNDHQFAARTVTRLAMSPGALSHASDWSPTLLRYAAGRIDDMRRLGGEARCNWMQVRAMIERERTACADAARS